MKTKQKAKQIVFKNRANLVSFILLLLLSNPVLADIEGLSAVKLVTTPDGAQEYSVTLQILALMTAFTFIPAFMMMMTSFTRIIIVFSILRQAMGLQQTPNNQIIVGLTLFLTFFIMSPVFNKANEQALQPYLAEEITMQEAAALAGDPFREFMLGQIREEDMGLFIRLAGEEGEYERPEDVPYSILLPSFVTSELKTAFQIGFMIFIPFLIIDMVVASVLMAMGMMMLSPMIISLPFKIMLFVLVDGWSLIMGTLAASFGI